MMHIYSLALEERKTAARSLRKVGKEILSPGSLSHISIINHLSISLSSCKEDEVLALNMQ